jgi:hypothetical protein
MSKLFKNLSVDAHRLNGPWHPQVISDSSSTSKKIVDYIDDVVKSTAKGNTSAY